MTVEHALPKSSTPSDFSEYARILLAHRRMIAGFVAVACVLAVALSFIGPETYRARVTLIVEDSPGSMLPGNLMDNPLIMDILGATGGTYHSGRIQIEMLSSRSVMEAVARQLDLPKVFKYTKLPPAEAMEETLTRLENAARFVETESGIIRVDVRTGTTFFPTPAKRAQAAQLAADIANAFADQLNLVNSRQGAARARTLRIYLEEQIREMETALHATADTLARFQLDNRTVALEEQTKAAVAGAGSLWSEMAATEVSLGMMQRMMRPENPQVQATRARLDELRRQYSRLTTGDPAEGDYLIPFTSLPGIGQRLARLMLDVKIKQSVLQLLTSQYYQARIEETKNVPSLTILDRGMPPVRRSWPKRKNLLVMTFAGSFAAAAVLALALDQRRARAAGTGGAPGAA